MIRDQTAMNGIMPKNITQRETLYSAIECNTMQLTSRECLEGLAVTPLSTINSINNLDLHSIVSIDG